MSDPESDKLNDLGARIRQAEKDRKPEAEASEISGEGMKGSRIGFDFVATVAAGGLIGWLADRQFGSQPWGLLLMLLAGFAAGIMNLWRALNRAEDGKTKDGK